MTGLGIEVGNHGLNPWDPSRGRFRAAGACKYMIFVP